MRSTMADKFQVIEGGKEDEKPSAEGENWLAKLPKGAVFLYRPYKSRQVSLSIRQVLFHWDGDVTLLGLSLRGEEQMETEYVDARLFSNLNEHVKTIYVAPTIEELQQQMEHANDGTEVRPKEVE